MWREVYHLGMGTEFSYAQTTPVWHIVSHCGLRIKTELSAPFLAPCQPAHHHAYHSLNAFFIVGHLWRRVLKETNMSHILHSL